MSPRAERRSFSQLIRASKKHQEDWKLERKNTVEKWEHCRDQERNDQ